VILDAEGKPVHVEPIPQAPPLSSYDERNIKLAQMWHDRQVRLGLNGRIALP